MKSVKLNEITLNITDGKHGDCVPANNSGFYFISCKDIHDGKIDYDNARQISKESFAEAHSRTRLSSNDILLTNSGTIGRMAFIKNVPKTYKTTFQKSVAIIKPDATKVVPMYLYYQLQNYVTEFVNSSNGSAQKNLLLSTMRSFSLNIHENLETQEKLADILSSYDDLIENNQKQIALLEEAAQRLYKEWFVDLRFPGHEKTPITDGVPEGWRNKCLSDVIAHEIGGGWGADIPNGKSDQEAFVIRGTDFYAITHGGYMEIPFRYHTLNNLKERTLTDNDIIFEVSGGGKAEGVAKTVLIKQPFLTDWKKPVICASFCKLIRLEDTLYCQYFYDHLQYLRCSGRTAIYDKRSASSIVNYRWKDFLAQETVLLPPRKIMQCYNKISEVFYQKIINCSRGIKIAKEARDRLLPKLMGGEMEV